MNPHFTSGIHWYPSHTCTVPGLIFKKEILNPFPPYLDRIREYRIGKGECLECITIASLVRMMPGAQGPIRSADLSDDDEDHACPKTLFNIWTRDATRLVMIRALIDFSHQDAACVFLIKT